VSRLSPFNSQKKNKHIDKIKKPSENSEEKMSKLSNNGWIYISFYGNVSSTKNARFWVKLYKKGVLL